MEQLCISFHSFGVDDNWTARIRKALMCAGLLVLSQDAGPAGDVVLCLPDASDQAIAALQNARSSPRSNILVVLPEQTTHGISVEWRLLRAGASEVFIITDGGEDAAAAQMYRKVERWQTLDRLTQEFTSRERIIGESLPWLLLTKRIVEAARYGQAPILLTGESGTGKEQLARLAHLASQRTDRAARGGELVTVDCGTLTQELAGSEFFGHERGAFTGALTQRDGAFAAADGGTLLLDEVGELPLPLQAQLLRAIQEKTFKRVGGNVWQKTEFRLICATNRNLEALVARSEFRLDLYHRISGHVFRTPRLRDRGEDILLLAEHFLTDYLGGKKPIFTDAVRELLLTRVYEGNVRELKQLMMRVAQRHVGDGPITAGDIPEDDRPASEEEDPWPDEAVEASLGKAIVRGMSLREINRRVTETAIRMAVLSEQGNLQRAARKLGVTDRALQMRRAALKAAS